MIVQSKIKTIKDEQPFGYAEGVFVTTRQFLKTKVIHGDRESSPASSHDPKKKSSDRIYIRWRQR